MLLTLCANSFAYFKLLILLRFFGSSFLVHWLLAVKSELEKPVKDNTPSRDLLQDVLRAPQN